MSFHSQTFFQPDPDTGLKRLRAHLIITNRDAQLSRFPHRLPPTGPGRLGHVDKLLLLMGEMPLNAHLFIFKMTTVTIRLDLEMSNRFCLAHEETRRKGKSQMISL